ncbi:MAG: Rieske 2Fe-2S domain-containing protein [Bdellovibrionales bacterium]|nr:Rieske 2Fe-2S domain-containing protein [Bdellovibrionales bacterium]
MRSACFCSLYLALIVFSWVLGGCQPSTRERPPGYLRIGEVREFAKADSFRPDFRLYFRRDRMGLSVMSTECTHDLNSLSLADSGEDRYLVCNLCGSEFNLNGDVRKGPAVTGLPFYEIRRDALLIGGPPNTLYVKIGTKVAKDWRLPISDIEEVQE